MKQEKYSFFFFFTSPLSLKQRFSKSHPKFQFRTIPNFGHPQSVQLQHSCLRERNSADVTRGILSRTKDLVPRLLAASRVAWFSLRSAKSLKRNLKEGTTFWRRLSKLFKHLTFLQFQVSSRLERIDMFWWVHNYLFVVRTISSIGADWFHGTFFVSSLFFSFSLFCCKHVHSVYLHTLMSVNLLSRLVCICKN